MSYKRVVERNGKKYGPYRYESYRDKDGNVKKRYIGKEEKTKKFSLSMFFVVGILALVFLLGASYTTNLIFNNSGSAGNFVSDVGNLFSGAYGGISGLVIGGSQNSSASVKPQKEVVKNEKPANENSKTIPVLVSSGGQTQTNKKSVENVPVKKNLSSSVVPKVFPSNVQSNKTSEVPVKNETGKQTQIVENNTQTKNETQKNVIINQTAQNETPTNETNSATTNQTFLNQTNQTLQNETQINQTLLNQTNQTSQNETPTNETNIAPTNETNATVITIPTNETLLNQTNETPLNQTNETLLNQTNETLVNQTQLNVSNVSALQYKAVIGRPVKWIKTINISEGNLNIKIPLTSTNISILTDNEVDNAIKDIDNYNHTVNQVNRKDLADGSLLTGNVVLDIDEGHGWLTRFWDWLTSFRITGNVVLTKSIKNHIVETNNSKIVEVGKMLNISDVKKVAVEYYTQSPVSNETNLTDGKRVVISAPSELNYTDILAYALINKKIKMGDPNLKVYWYPNSDDANKSVQNLLKNYSSPVRESIPYKSFDFNGDGYVDYIEWVVPHLSDQVYDIIYITKAEHLDTNRSFISDIYPEVKTLDNNWSEAINNGEYVRVTFEIPLDSSRDITFYGRGVNGTASINVFTEDGNKSIATFRNVSDAGWYKIYLTNLTGTEDVFDLRINGTAEFDYIVDPTWWNSSWLYKKQINISENSGNTLNNYSVLMYIPYSANMNADFSDLRFIADDNITELNYWIQNYTASTDAYVWVKVPTLLASSITNIYMYYGNNLATTTSSLLGVNNMWTTNYNGDSVTKVSPTGVMTNYAGTGTNPLGIAFDGINMWTTNYNGNSVTKVSPTGVMTTYTGTGYLPYRIAFDGTNMWITDNGDDSVTKVSPTGVMTTYAGTGTNPLGIAFDGTNMWAVNNGDDSVTKVSPTGVMTTYTGTGANPTAIAFDGTNMWITNYNGDSVTKVSPTGVMTTYTGTGSGPVAIAFDGTNMWTTNYLSYSVTKISPTGVMTNYAGTGSGPVAIAFDGTNMWTTNEDDNSVTKVSPTGVMTTYAGTGVDPEGIAFDGMTLINSPFSNIPTYTITDGGFSTCACPGLNNNWQIDMSDYCNITADCDLGTGQLNFTGSGVTTCNATINTTNLGDPGATGELKIDSGCIIWNY